MDEAVPPSLRPARFLRLLAAALLLGAGAAPAHAQTDSTAGIYEDIHEFARQRKFTRWIYSGIFVEPKAAEEPPASAPRTQRVNPFLKDQGKVIRHIEVRTLDPFGFSVDDTARSPVNTLQAWGNGLHRKTRPRVVRNLLLVGPRQPLDPLRMSESERVLRASPFITDARILVRPVEGARDSVDLLVLVHDKWSIDVDGEADLSGASGRIRDRNFLGWGQSLQQRVGFEPGVPQLELSGSHEVYNVRKSRISTLAQYAVGPAGGSMGLSLQRPFYSPLAKWGGGAAWGQRWGRYHLLDSLGAIREDHALSPASLDVWAGRSFRLGDGTEPGSRNSNFVLAGRYAQTRYAARPPAALDPDGAYRARSLFLLSTGLSIRQYYKERYLFRFGASEDVPEGLLLTFTTGMQKQERTANRPYLGADLSRGRNYARFGYFSAGLGYGTYFERGDLVESTFNLRLLYFTDLHSWGRWHFRQFFRFNAVYGHAKPAFARIGIDGDQLYGYSSGGRTGTRKELFRSETVFYAPWSFLGFKVAPVLLAGFATLGDAGDALFSGRMHSAFTVGLLVRNENLLVRTFELSLGFYPYLPMEEGPGVQLNPFQAFSAQVPGFDFGPPAEIVYE